MNKITLTFCQIERLYAISQSTNADTFKIFASQEFSDALVVFTNTLEGDKPTQIEIPLQ